MFVYVYINMSIKQKAFYKLLEAEIYRVSAIESCEIYTHKLPTGFYAGGIKKILNDHHLPKLKEGRIISDFEFKDGEVQILFEPLP